MSNTVFYLRENSRLWHPKGPRSLLSDEEGDGYRKAAGTKHFSGFDILTRANERLPPRVNVDLYRHGASAVDLASVATILSGLYSQSPKSSFYRIATPDEVVRVQNDHNAATLVLVVSRDMMGKNYNSGSLSVDLNFDVEGGNGNHLFIPTYLLHVETKGDDQHGVVLSVTNETESRIITGDYKPSTQGGLTWTSLVDLVENNFNVNSGEIAYRGHALPQGVGALTIAGKNIGIYAGIGERSPVYGIPLTYVTPDNK